MLTPLPVRDLHDEESYPIYFGVDWDEETPQIFNAIVLDVLALRSVVPRSGILTLVSKNPEFLRTISTTLELDSVSFTEDLGCTLWKLYYMKEQPPFPPGAARVYVKKVGIVGVNDTRLTQGEPRYPVLDDHDSKVLPPGKLYNVNKIPPRYYSPFPNMLVPTAFY